MSPKLQLSWELIPRVGLSLGLELLNPSQYWKNWPRTQQPSARPHSRFAIRFSLENLNSGRCFLSFTYSFCICYVLREWLTKQARKPRRALGAAAFFMGSRSHPLSFSTSAVLEEHLQIFLDFEWVWFFSQETHWRHSKWNCHQPTCLASIIRVLHYLWWLMGAASQHRCGVPVHTSLL